MKLHPHAGAIPIWISVQSIKKYVALKLKVSPLALTPNSVFCALSDVYLLWKFDASGSPAQNGGNAELFPPGL